MSREISLFTEYHQLENSVTNYCGLMMKLIYEENPDKFEELLSVLLNGEKQIRIGPRFTQQEKQRKSIPDLTIRQSAFTIFFENKTSNWFYSDQIERHLDSFSKAVDDKILFLMSKFETDDYEDDFKDQRKSARRNNTVLKPISYEDFIGTIENVVTSEALKSYLEEFKIYLDRNDLLPKWKGLLDVVSCSGSMHEIDDWVYMCPDTGGPYSHRRAKYFGPYANKKVSSIFEIEGIVNVGVGMEDQDIEWKNTDIPESELINNALAKIKSRNYRVEENEETPLKVFLLNNRAETAFFKKSKGGMVQSKIYFWGIGDDVKNSKELAKKLTNKYWEDFK